MTMVIMFDILKNFPDVLLRSNVYPFQRDDAEFFRKRKQVCMRSTVTLTQRS